MSKGTELSARLRQNYLTNGWLVHQLEKRGISTQPQEISNTFHGLRRGEKVDRILATTEAILADYEREWA